MAAYRPAGLSDSSDEELTCVRNNISTNKVCSLNITYYQK